MKNRKVIKSNKWNRRRNKNFFCLKNKIIMPKVGKIYPNLIMTELVSVRPLSGEMFHELQEARKKEYAKIAKFGSIYPSWIERLAFDGKEFISIDQFIKWFGKNKLLIKSIQEKDLRSNL